MREIEVFYFPDNWSPELQRALIMVHCCSAIFTHVSETEVIVNVFDSLKNRPQWMQEHFERKFKKLLKCETTPK